MEDGDAALQEHVHTSSLLLTSTGLSNLEKLRYLRARAYERIL